MTLPKKAKTTGIGDLYHVQWLDHCSFLTNRWHDIDDVDNTLKPIVVNTVGYLIREEKTHIILAATISDQDHFGGEMCILKSDIKKRKRIIGFKYEAPKK